MITFITNNLLWTQATPIVAVLGALLLCGFFYSRILLYSALAVFLFCVYFFRNPDRVCYEALTDASVMVCPADGKVVDVQYDASAPFDGYEQKVAIFLSVFDVHVQWLPFAGTVKHLLYTPGLFAFAFLPKSSLLNERNDVVIQRADGSHYKVRQIAGAVARRILWWVKEGEEVATGQKYGMIRFGSRVEVMLPASVKLSVGVGQRVYGGKTVLGRWQ